MEYNTFIIDDEIRLLLDFIKRIAQTRKESKYSWDNCAELVSWQAMQQSTLNEELECFSAHSLND